MRKFILRHFFLMLVLSLFSFSLSPSVIASEKTIRLENSNLTVVLENNRSYKVSFDGKSYSESLPQKPYIRSRNFKADPLNGPNLLNTPDDSSWYRNIYGEGLFIVQFFTQAFEAYQEEITRLGGIIRAPFPDHALIVEMSDETRNTIATFDYVRWIGPMQISFKLDEELIQGTASFAEGSIRCSILLFEATDQEGVISYIESINGGIDLSTESNRFEASLNREQILSVAALNEVQFIDRWTPSEDDMDNAREISGANFLEKNFGYTGKNVRGEVLDDGVRSSHIDFQKNPPFIHGSNSDDFDHGTSVYSILFSSGMGDEPAAKGILHNASRPIFSSRYFVKDRYAHTRELVDPKGPYRAVFQTNSWGGQLTLDYTTVSAEMDQMIFDLDILITQSQSNTRNQLSRPQAWAKNIVSVGGVRHYDTLDRSDDLWFDPEKTSGGSIGPASDGRIKPDVWHFYDFIRAAGDTDDRSYREFGGTSGATPIVAGYFGLLFEMWADGVFSGSPGQKRDVFSVRPHATTAKALMIHSAFQYPFEGEDHDKGRCHQGWGMPDVKNLYEMAKRNHYRLPILIDETRPIQPLKRHLYYLLTYGNEPLKATLVYADPAGIVGAAHHRINDISLKVTQKGGEVYWGNNGLDRGVWSTPGGESNKVDTVENVFIQNPGHTLWKIEVIGDEIVKDARSETKCIDADYALVVTGGFRVTAED